MRPKRSREPREFEFERERCKSAVICRGYVGVVVAGRGGRTSSTCCRSLKLKSCSASSEADWPRRQPATRYRESLWESHDAAICF
jgi:hypothetical protein